MMQAQRSATQHSTAQYALCGCRVFAAASVTRGGEAGACTTQCTCTLCCARACLTPTCDTGRSEHATAAQCVLRCTVLSCAALCLHHDSMTPHGSHPSSGVIVFCVDILRSELPNLWNALRNAIPWPQKAASAARVCQLLAQAATPRLMSPHRG